MQCYSTVTLHVSPKTPISEGSKKVTFKNIQILPKFFSWVVWSYRYWTYSFLKVFHEKSPVPFFGTFHELGITLRSISPSMYESQIFVQRVYFKNIFLYFFHFFSPFIWPIFHDVSKNLSSVPRTLSWSILHSFRSKNLTSVYFTVYSRCKTLTSVFFTIYFKPKYRHKNSVVGPCRYWSTHRSAAAVLWLTMRCFNYNALLKSSCKVFVQFATVPQPKCVRNVKKLGASANDPF